MFNFWPFLCNLVNISPRHIYMTNSRNAPQIDLADIADAYEDVRGESLERAIKADCSGDYMRMLISLVRRK